MTGVQTCALRSRQIALEAQTINEISASGAGGDLRDRRVAAIGSIVEGKEVFEDRVVNRLEYRQAFVERARNLDQQICAAI